MAEGFARHRYSDLMDPYSAGVMPASIVQPETIAAMSEIDIDIAGQHPKIIREVDWKSCDLVVNMSGTGILQMLPGYQGGNLIWAVDDPIGGSTRKYRRVRDRIEKLVDELAKTLRRQLPD